MMSPSTGMTELAGQRRGPRSTVNRQLCSLAAGPPVYRSTDHKRLQMADVISVTCVSHVTENGPSFGACDLMVFLRR